MFTSGSVVPTSSWRGYEYLFERWEECTRSARAHITSKRKWQQDWRVGQIKRWEVWFVFCTQRATCQCKFSRSLLLCMGNMMCAGNRFLCGALHSSLDMFWMMNHAWGDHFCPHQMKTFVTLIPLCETTDAWNFDELQQSWTFQWESMRSSMTSLDIGRCHYSGCQNSWFRKTEPCVWDSSPPTNLKQFCQWKNYGKSLLGCIRHRVGGLSVKGWDNQCSPLLWHIE